MSLPHRSYSNFMNVANSSGEIVNQADIARREGITRARVTQVMGMLRLDSHPMVSILTAKGSPKQPRPA